MLSQRTVIWVGAAALVVVAAGAGAVVWTHPELLRLSPAAAPPVVASAPAEPKPASAPKAPPAVEAAAPAATGPPAPDKAPSQAAAAAVGPAFDVVNVDPSGDAVIAGRAAPSSACPRSIASRVSPPARFRALVVAGDAVLVDQRTFRRRSGGQCRPLRARGAGVTGRGRQKCPASGDEQDDERAPFHRTSSYPSADGTARR